MNLVDCEHPIRVYNKYIGEYVWTSCGSCKTCRRKKANRWISRLETERSQHPFCFFVTLTYDNNHLPILCKDRDSDIMYDWLHDDISVDYKDLICKTPADKIYLTERLRVFRGIPYANFSDIQKFHKRLNKYFHDNVTKKYENFRYFTISEYGSTTLRPHFHSLYFVDNQSVADCFEEVLCSCWKLGHCHSDSVRRTASSYCAQYLNELFDLPSFYQVRPLRPKFVCSKRPPIGAFAERPEDYKEIFDKGLCYRFVTDSKDSSKLTPVPLLPCIKNRLFPKLKAFNRISDSLRTALYGLSIRRVGKEGETPYLRTFEEFLAFCYSVVYSKFEIYGHSKFSPFGFVRSDLADYIRLCAHHFSDTGLNCLKRLYYVSKRVARNCLEFGLTLDKYVAKIVDFYDRQELYILRQFYTMQSLEKDSEALVYAYHEFAYNNNRSNWSDLSSLSLPKLSDCVSYIAMCEENKFAYEKATKSHFKNSYFDALRDKNNKLFNLLKNYQHAKKCYETSEACT